MSQIFQEIKTVLEEEKKKGTFTHYGFSCGSFSQEKPRFALFSSNKETIFDLASLTKVFVTSALFLEEFHKGLASQKMTVREYLEGYSEGLREELKELLLGDLLSHNSGLPAWFNFWTQVDESSLNTTRSELIRRLNEASRKLEKDQGFLYSDVGYILLGLCLELKHKKSLKELFYIFCQEKLGFCNKPLLFSQDVPSQLCVPTSFCAVRKRSLQGEVHDENCAFLGGATGHAGLFGDLIGVISFTKKLVERKSFDRVTAISSCLGPCSYGWRTKIIDGRRALGHLGFTGTGFFLFPEENAYLLLLTNRVVSSRLNKSFQQTRQKVFQLGRALLDNELNK